MQLVAAEDLFTRHDAHTVELPRGPVARSDRTRAVTASHRAARERIRRDPSSDAGGVGADPHPAMARAAQRWRTSAPTYGPRVSRLHRSSGRCPRSTCQGRDRRRSRADLEAGRVPEAAASSRRRSGGSRQESGRTSGGASMTPTPPRRQATPFATSVCRGSTGSRTPPRSSTSSTASDPSTSAPIQPAPSTSPTCAVHAGTPSVSGESSRSTWPTPYCIATSTTSAATSTSTATPTSSIESPPESSRRADLNCVNLHE